MAMSPHAQGRAVAEKHKASTKVTDNTSGRQIFSSICVSQKKLEGPSDLQENSGTRTEKQPERGDPTGINQSRGQKGTKELGLTTGKNEDRNQWRKGGRQG